MFIETLTASANKYETRNRKASKAARLAVKHVARQTTPDTAETAIRPNLQNPTWRNTSNDEKRDLITELVNRITDPDDLERLYRYANRLFCSK